MADEVTTPVSETPSTTETPPANGGNDEGKKFTQADLDRLIGEARQKAADSTRKKVLAELEIDDPDSDKELLKAAKAKREADKTEVERAAGEATKEKERREKVEQEFADFKAGVEAERRLTTLNTAVKDALAKANAKADKVLKLLRADHADSLDAVLKEDGTVDEKKLTALVDAARKQYPEDFGKGGVGSPSNSGGRSPQLGADAAKRASQLNQSRIRG